MLEAAAGPRSGATTSRRSARALVLPPGASPAPDAAHDRAGAARCRAAAPHRSRSSTRSPIRDPLDEVIRERSRRHVVFTSALAIALGLGLLATIRGAARARELAQLKSDFVSTVSHELKTPLTSIRMFAEMLEQGVAQGDAGEDGALPRRDRPGEPAARPADREPARLRADRARHAALHADAARASRRSRATR